MVRGERERSRLIPELNRFPAANPSRTASIIFQESTLTKESVQDCGAEPDLGRPYPLFGPQPRGLSRSGPSILPDHFAGAGAGTADGATALLLMIPAAGAVAAG